MTGARGRDSLHEVSLAMKPPAEAIDALPLFTFAPGEVLLHEGSPTDKLYFLMSGTVEVTKEGQSITRVREVGAIFGEMSLLLDVPHTATVSAVNEVTCRVAESPEAFFTAHPQVVLYVCWVLARRLDSLNRYLVDIKAQFADRSDHLGMVDEVLSAIMNRQPRPLAKVVDAGQ